MNKRLDVLSPRPKREEGTWWHKIGSAFEGKDGGINVVLDSLPLPDEKGRVSFIIREAKDLREASGTSQRSAPPRQAQYASPANNPIDDSIPFDR